MSEAAPGFRKHPDYRVDIEPASERVRVLVGDAVLADTQRALRVTETRHHPVWYVPLADVDDALLEPTAHSTYCPFKGQASYWSIRAAGTELENAMWGYRTPYAECAALEDHVAFYTDRVDLEIDGALSGRQGPGWTG
jgi:acyl-CoA thioesterase-2